MIETRWPRTGSSVPGADLVQALALLVVIPVVLQGRQDAAGLVWAVPVAAVAAAAHVAVLGGDASVSWRAPRSTLRLAVPVVFVAATAVLSQHGEPTWSMLCILAALQVSQVLEVSLVPVGIAVVAIASVPVVTVAKPWPFGLLVFVSALIAWLRRRLMHTIEELHDARDELAAAAVESERQRFSRDLHDLLGHTLSVVVVAAQVVAGTVRAKPDLAIETAREIEQTGRRALGEVRAAVGAYRSDSLATVLAGVRSSMRTARIELRLTGEDVALRPDLDELAGWTVREAITNVIRHSHARCCTITIVTGAGGLTVDVADDGNADATALARAEDQGLMRSSLETLLGLEDDLEVVAVVADGRAALDHVRQHAPDIALLDIEMPELTGLEVLTACRDEALTTRCLIITTFARPGYVRRAMDAGARGLFIKDAPIQELVQAVRDVHAGRTALSGSLAVAAFDSPPNPLTGREIDVLRASTDGRTIQQIADHLHLSHSTVRNYLSDAIHKTGTANRAAARHRAQESGWL